MLIETHWHFAQIVEFLKCQICGTGLHRIVFNVK